MELQAAFAPLAAQHAAICVAIYADSAAQMVFCSTAGVAIAAIGSPARDLVSIFGQPV
jgi:hypothetical protein